MKLFNGEIRSLLYVKDYQAMTHYYGEVLGLKRVCEWTDGKFHSCQFAIAENGRIELTDCPAPIPQGPTSLWVEASSVDDVYTTLQNTPESNIDEPLSDRYYHARVFTVVDPEGNSTAIVNYEKDVQPGTGEIPKEEFFKNEFRAVSFVEDLNACLRFYTEVLELECVYSWYEGPGDHGFKYQVDGHNFVETLHRIPLVPQGATTIMLEAENLDFAYQRITSKENIKLIEDLHDTPQGIRAFEIMDPNGNGVIIFSASEKK